MIDWPNLSQERKKERKKKERKKERRKKERKKEERKKERKKERRKKKERKDKNIVNSSPYLSLTHTEPGIFLYIFNIFFILIVFRLLSHLNMQRTVKHMLVDFPKCKKMKLYDTIKTLNRTILTTHLWLNQWHEFGGGTIYLFGQWQKRACSGKPVWNLKKNLLQAGDASGAEITHLTFSKYMKSNQ